MKRKDFDIKEFNNGNLSIRLPKEYIKRIKNRNLSAIEVISWVLDEFDCYFIGNEFCLGNAAMGAMIYNLYSDVVYIINLNDIDTKLMTGHWLRLYARVPDDDDREIIHSEWED